VEGAAARLGLVSPKDAGVVVSRHIADSLLFALARRPKPEERWLDVGSGAGFPGMPLAICFPEATFTLLEPSKRRAGFLELVSADLGLANVAVEARRLESLTGAWDVAVARAVADPATALGAMSAAVRSGGVAIVAVGPNAQVVEGAEVVRVADLGNVDSPGLFSMMTREG
jgi:16S rRNA (guanine527-N7)-methyltransferase